ncbi:MAG: hypothetical protein HY258_10720 [Chloroflexi bacterium]|nr:hypothetical protein [Chloroflexota bacterium]
MEIVIVVGTVDSVDKVLSRHGLDDRESAHTTSWESRFMPDFERLWKNVEQILPESPLRRGHPYLGDGHI